MDGSKLIAWAIAVVVLAFGIAVLGGPQAFIGHITRVAAESPTLGSLFGAILSEIKVFAWDLFPFALLFILLWGRVR